MEFSIIQISWTGFAGKFSGEIESDFVAEPQVSRFEGAFLMAAFAGVIQRPYGFMMQYGGSGTAIRSSLSV